MRLCMLGVPRGVAGPQSLRSVRTSVVGEHLIVVPPGGGRYSVPEEWPYEEARGLFKTPVVTEPENVPELKWTAPDEEVHPGPTTLILPP